jgi:hypothetical protein
MWLRSDPRDDPVFRNSRTCILFLDEDRHEMGHPHNKHSGKSITIFLFDMGTGNENTLMRVNDTLVLHR